MTLDLRNLIEANGTVARGRAALAETLRELGADAVTFEAADPDYLGRDIFSHTVGRAIEAEIEPVVDLLSDIPVSEDDEPTVDIFSRLGQAETYCINDRCPSDDPEVQGVYGRAPRRIL